MDLGEVRELRPLYSFLFAPWSLWLAWNADIAQRNVCCDFLGVRGHVSVGSLQAAGSPALCVLGQVGQVEGEIMGPLSTLVRPQRKL